MAHIRQQLRAAATAALTNQTAAGARVFPSRVYPLAAADLPALLIYTTVEASEEGSIDSPRRLIRTTQLHVRIRAKAAVGVDDVLDAIAVDVEKRMASDPSFGGLAKNSILTGSTAAFTGQGDDEVGELTLDYAVELHTAEDDPEHALA